MVLKNPSVDWDPACLEAAWAALYLPGGRRPFAISSRKWPAVEHVFRRHGPSPEALERCGLYAEALLLNDAALLEWASEAVQTGVALTVFSAGYPTAWLEKLGKEAPPALWKRGPVPAARFLGVVGSRTPTAASLAFARACAHRVAEAGFGLASGGAQGIDAAAMASYLAAGGNSGLTILPRGLTPEDGADGVCVLSLEPPGAPFNRLSALARNALIYALGEPTIVIQPRFREGGTWHGASDALRRRLGRLLVMEEPGNRAVAALKSLGASPLTESDVRDAHAFANGLLRPPLQESLFACASR